MTESKPGHWPTTKEAAEIDSHLSFAAYIRMFVIGIGYLFPISAIWAAFDYWKMLFPDKNIEFGITCVYQAGSVLTVLLLSLSRHVNFNFRIYGGFSGQIIGLTVIFLFRWIPGVAGHPEVQYPLLFGMVLMMAIVTGFLDSALLALCSQYTPRMQEAMQMGVGCSMGVSVIFKDITKAMKEVTPISPEDASSIYFLMGIATVFGCIVSYFSLMRMPVSSHIHTLSDEIEEEEVYLELREEGEHHHTPLRQVIGRCWVQQLTIFSHFLITTLAFPSLITAIPYHHQLGEALGREHWFQTVLLSVFVVSDIIARSFVRRRGALNYSNIWVTVIIRLLFLPLLLGASIGALRSDLVSALAVAIVGAFNGYTNSLSLIVVNEIPGLSLDEKKSVGRFSACALNMGLCAGGFLAMGVAVYFGLSES